MDVKKLLHNKWVWVIGGVLLLGLFLLSRKSSAAADTSIPYAPGADPTGSVGGSSGSSGGSDTGSSSGVPSGSYVTPSQLVDVVGSLSKSFADSMTAQRSATDAAMASALSTQKSDFLGQLDAMQSVFGDQQHALVNELNLAHGSGVVDPFGINQDVPAAWHVEVPSSAGVFAPTVISGGGSGGSSNYFGEGGINYGTATKSQQKAIVDRDKRLQTDSVYLASELKRTNEVIASRSSRDMDISAQQKELSKLTKIASTKKKAG